MKTFFLSLFFISFFVVALLQKKQQPAIQKTPDKHFVIIISAYNSADIVVKTLSSLLEQTYPHYQVLYIDNGSEDITKKEALNFIKTYDKEKKITFYTHKQKGNLLESSYNIAKNIPDDHIIIFLDERAYFSRSTILEEMNFHFKNADIWLMYGMERNAITKKKNKALPIDATDIFFHSARIHPWKRFYCKAFYSFLFKNIKQEDLLIDGNFISHIFDAAYMYPMIEMAKKHVFFSSKILCDFIPQNTSIQIVDNETLRKHFSWIRQKRPYKALSKNAIISLKEKE